ncbi:unnamed protein product [Spirodela intermedia]|uniref:Uncharacterized protein n=2 Tax=Spirodela intermedia TaxID=51605 RepID=A0A7I8L4A7_SPIIN|nr:unnamed protein product [Spirodela intermedia]CAA6667250.1 unnamed protein product [Spirodela intermedia]CAA7404074.1 unnamed protein product [Spirodela intermedia]
MAGKGRKFLDSLPLICLMGIIILLNLSGEVAAARPLGGRWRAAAGQVGSLLFEVLPQGSGSGPGASGCTYGSVQNGGTCPP